MQVDSRTLLQKRSNFCLPKVTSFFIQAAGLAYHHRAKCGAYHQGRQAALVSHHATACITLRLDEMQCCALMIYRRQAADDIQGFALIYSLKSNIMLLKGVVIYGRKCASLLRNGLFEQILK